MMRARRLALLAVLAASCGGASDDRPRYVSEEDHASLVAPAGWTIKREYGSLVFVAPEDGPARGTSIAIRAVKIEGDWTQTRTEELVLPATEKVLRSLPKAEVTALERGISTGDFTGAAFHVSFVPEGKKRRYERRHVVLTGGSGDYLFHVMHTAPDTRRLEVTKNVLADVLATLREEV